MKPFKYPFRASLSLAIILALLTVTIALAASGDLDLTFSGDGKIIQSFGGVAHTGLDVAVQSDGKVVAVGEKFTSIGRDFAIARYNTDGSLDTTFSGDGRQVVNVGVLDQPFGVAIQTDGRIVVGGETCDINILSCDVALIRLNSDGSLDASFSGDGKVVTDVDGGDNGGVDLVLQGNKIVIGGYLQDGTNYNGAVYRYNANGSLDPSFSGDGILPANFGQDDLFLAITQYSGKIYVVGQSGPTYANPDFFITARVNADGTLDTTFSGDGKVKTSLGGYDVATKVVVSNGKVIVVGASDNNIAIVQYTATGVLDPSFSGDGKLKANFGFPSAMLQSVAMQGSKIVVVGGTDALSGDALLVRFTANGSLDSGFGAGGIVVTDWGGGDYLKSVAIKNARVYVVGVSTITVNRFIIAAYKP
ncbi:MAG: hypothetical protein HY867_20550 [Chloroflexi bacterium]|nr:hypothetical protein [Chloroflexota bacterium]